MSSNTVTEYGSAVAIDFDVTRPDPHTVKMFSILFENSNVLFFVVPPAGNCFTYLSKAVAKLLGYEQEDLLCKPAKAVVSHASLTSLCNALHRTAAAGIAVDGIINLVPHPIELVRKDKTVVRGEVRCAIQMSTDHTINSISGIIQLVSDSATAELESTPVDRPGQRHVTAPASKTTIDQKTADSFTQQGKILIMDDEDILIDIAAQIGKRMGLIVESAKTGEEAIEIYRKALELGCPHDAILLDMTIAGGMGGLEASQVLHTINPDISTIVMSGYSDHEVMAAPDKYGFKGVISKPFRLTEFGKVLRELIPAEKFKIG